jgi:hypothetical protein
MVQKIIGVFVQNNSYYSPVNQRKESSLKSVSLGYLQGAFFFNQVGFRIARFTIYWLKIIPSDLLSTLQETPLLILIPFQQSIISLLIH